MVCSKWRMNTQELHVEITKEGTGRLEIIYLLEVSGISESVNTLKIDIM